MKTDLVNIEDSLKYFAISFFTLVIYTILNDPIGVLNGMLKCLF